MHLNTYDKINLIAAYHFIVGGLYLLLAGAIIVLPVSAVLLEASEFLARLPGWFLGLILLAAAGLVALVSLINLVLGWGLWQLKPWGRVGAMIAAVFRLPFVPIGTIAGGVILYVLLQDETRALFTAPAPAEVHALPEPAWQDES